MADSSEMKVSSLGSDSITGRPSSRAACFTGFGTNLRPRPVGASGRVSTATTSKCSVSSASSSNDGTATSGVPANSTFSMESPPYQILIHIVIIVESFRHINSTHIGSVCNRGNATHQHYAWRTAGIFTPASMSNARNARESLNRTPRMPALFAPTIFMALSSTNTAPEASMPNCCNANS